MGTRHGHAHATVKQRHPRHTHVLSSATHAAQRCEVRSLRTHRTLPHKEARGLEGPVAIEVRRHLSLEGGHSQSFSRLWKEVRRRMAHECCSPEEVVTKIIPRYSSMNACLTGSWCASMARMHARWRLEGALAASHHNARRLDVQGHTTSNTVGARGAHSASMLGRNSAGAQCWPRMGWPDIMYEKAG
jgi:hypothetical protein